MARISLTCKWAKHARQIAAWRLSSPVPPCLQGAGLWVGITRECCEPVTETRGSEATVHLHTGLLPREIKINEFLITAFTGDVDQVLI